MLTNRIKEDEVKFELIGMDERIALDFARRYALSKKRRSTQYEMGTGLMHHGVSRKLAVRSIA